MGKIMGVVIAGGGATRFGGDKGAALVDGLPLLDHIIVGMYKYVDKILISGRKWRDFDSVDDGEWADQGPLGGLITPLNLCHDAILTAPCDVLEVPDMSKLIGDGPACFAEQPLFGYWPASLAPILTAYLADQPDRSMRRWLDHIGARQVASDTPFHNFNTRNDIMLYEAQESAR